MWMHTPTPPKKSLCSLCSTRPSKYDRNKSYRFHPCKSVSSVVKNLPLPKHSPRSPRSTRLIPIHSNPSSPCLFLAHERRREPKLFVRLGVKPSAVLFQPTFHEKWDEPSPTPIKHTLFTFHEMWMHTPHPPKIFMFYTAKICRGLKTPFSHPQKPLFCPPQKPPFRGYENPLF